MSIDTGANEAIPTPNPSVVIEEGQCDLPSVVDLSDTMARLDGLTARLNEIYNRHVTAMDTVAGIMIQAEYGVDPNNPATARPYQFKFDPVHMHERQAVCTHNKQEAMNRIAAAAGACLGTVEMTHYQMRIGSCVRLFDMLIAMNDCDLPADYQPTEPVPMKTIPVVAEPRDPLHVHFTLAAAELLDGLVEAVEADLAIMEECAGEAEFTGRQMAQTPETYNAVNEGAANINNNIAEIHDFTLCLNRFLTSTPPYVRMC